MPHIVTGAKRALYTQMMTETVLVPTIALLLGALCYALAPNGKVQELGRLVFSAAAFWLLYVLSHIRLH